MKNNFWLGLALFVVGMPALAQAPSDKAKLQGKWSVVSAEENGQATKFKANLEIKGEMLSFVLFSDSSGEKEIEQYTFTVDATKSPKEFDQRPIKGQKKLLKGIYKLKKDMLTLCLNKKGGEQRPTDFTTQKGDGRILVVLKRVAK